MSEYYFMNKNEKLLKFHIEKNLFDNICVETESYSNLRPIGFTDINEWILGRNYAKHKDHLKKWLSEWGMDTTEGFIEITHCLGLNDTLWVKQCDSTITWDEINLYDNEFSDIVEHTAFNKGLNGLKLKTTSPEFTSEGSFAKCWKRRDDSIELIKKGADGAANYGLEPYSEYYSSRILSNFTQETISYDLEIFNKSVCTNCKLFTSEDVGFTPFYKIITDNKTYNLSSVFKLCQELGFEYEFRRMIFLDSIIFNPDRHLGNFGFLTNNDTFEIVGFAPLFDFNMALMARAMDNDFTKKDPFRYINEYGVEHKLGGTFSEIGKQILTLDMKKKLPSHNSIIINKHPKYNLSEERLENLQIALYQNYDKILGRELVPVQ